MPNLGRLDGDPSLGALQFSTEATLADLPGLIEGAHLGKVLVSDLDFDWYCTMVDTRTILVILLCEVGSVC
jgi:hypothetical protein